MAARWPRTPLLSRVSTASPRWSARAMQLDACGPARSLSSTAARAPLRSSGANSMPDLFDLLTQLAGERPSSLFATLLVVHIAAGLTAVVAGATAMLSPKRRGRHPKTGRIYYAGLCVLCATAVGMAMMRWPEDVYLVVL